MNDQFNIKNTLNSIAEFCALVRDNELITQGLWYRTMGENRKVTTVQRQYQRLCAHIKRAVPNKYFPTHSGISCTASFDEIKEGYFRYLNSVIYRGNKPHCPTCGRVFLGVK